MSEASVVQSRPKLELAVGPISRTTLALYAGASGDHNPIHIDIDFARSVGKTDVFAHGMLTMAYLGRLVATEAGGGQLRRFRARFVGVAQVGETLICSLRPKAAAPGEIRGDRCFELSVMNESGELKIAGEAVVADGEEVPA